MAANREGELVWLHLHLDFPLVLIDRHGLDLCRGQGVAGIRLDVFGPAHDVNALSAQFVDDGLHATAPDADARADGINVVIVADHRDLCALAGFPRSVDDAHDSVENLRDFHLEEFD